MTSPALDLVGPAEIGERLGMKPASVITARYRGRMPEPEWVISGVPIWRWSVIERWAAETRRLPEIRAGEASADDVAEAMRRLPEIRRQVAREIMRQADELEAFRAQSLRRPGRKARGDGKGNGVGEWDWYFELSAAQRAHYRRFMVASPNANAPDQYQETVRDRLEPETTLEDCMARWRYAWDVEIAARQVAHGKPPAIDVAGTSYPATVVFGPDAARALARSWTGERLDAEHREAKRSARSAVDVEDF